MKISQHDRQYILENADRKSVKELSAELGVKERRIDKFLKSRKGHIKVTEPAGGGEKKESPRTIFYSALILMILVGIAFSNSVYGKFLLDDDLLLKDNGYVKSFAYIPSIFTSGLGKGIGLQSHYYRPLQVLIYMVIYHFWKFNPVPYHIVNIILHMLVVLCVYWLINVLYGNRVLSLFASALYAVHPIHCESVSYISGTADCLAGLFVLLTMIFYIRYVSRTNIVEGALFLICYVVAIFAKENSLILPALLLLYHYAFNKRVKMLPFAASVVIAIGYIVFRTSVLKSAVPQMHSADIIGRIPGFFVAVTGYVRILFLPVDLYMGHESKLFRFNDPMAMAGMAIVLGLAGLVLKTKRRASLVCFSVLWFFITLLPVSNLYPITFYMADHYLYLPSIGFFLVAAALLYKAYRSALRIYAVIFLAAVTGFYCYLTAAQNGYWKDPLSFYERTVAYAPDNVRTYVNLGIQYMFDKKFDKAAEMYKAAIALDPAFGNAYHGLGMVAKEQGKNDEAIAHLKKAVELSPQEASHYFMLGAVCASAGKKEEAIGAYKEGLARSPTSAEAMNNLAAIYYESGRTEEAVELIKKAIAANPDYHVGYSNLAFIYNASGKSGEALALYEKAIRLYPDSADVYNKLGVCYYTMGRKKDARNAYLKCLKRDPRNVLALNNLAINYYEDGEAGKAVEMLNKALEIDPGYKDARNNLAKMLSQKAGEGAKKR